MVYGIKIVLDICFENVADSSVVLGHLSFEVIESLDGFESSFSFPIGIVVINEGFIKNGFDDVADGVVNDPISKI